MTNPINDVAEPEQRDGARMYAFWTDGPACGEGVVVWCKHAREWQYAEGGPSDGEAIAPDELRPLPKRSKA